MADRIVSIDNNSNNGKSIAICDSARRSRNYSSPSRDGEITIRNLEEMRAMVSVKATNTRMLLLP